MAKKDDNGDEPDAARQQADAKTSSEVSHFSRMKMSYNRNAATLRARESDRTAVQAVRPMKDTPIDPMAMGSSTDLAAKVQSSVSGGVVDSTDEGDTDDSSGESGSSGKGDSGGGGGGPNLTPAPDTGYVSFADGGSEAKIDAVKAKKSNEITAPEAKEKAIQGPKIDVKATVKTVSGSKAGAPAAPGKAGGPSSGSNAPPTP